MSSSEPDRAEQLARRRQKLVSRSGRLRGQVVDQLQVLQPAWTWADRLQDAWVWVRTHPMSVAGGVLAVVVWRPRRSLGLALRLWSGWKLLQRVRSLGHSSSRLL